MAVRAADLYLDYSKHRVTAETLELLVALAEAADLRGRIEAMFRGEHINVSEDRAGLHTRYVCRAMRTWWWPARMWCPTCTGSWTAWATSPGRSVAESGPGTPAS